MKQKLIITPINLVNTHLTFEYKDEEKKEHVLITSDFRLIVGKEYMKEGMKPLKHVFSEQSTVFKFEWDDSNDRMTQVADAMKRHPLLKCDGNTNMVNKPIFNLVDVGKKTYTNAYDIKKKGLLFNLVNNTNLARMKEIAYCIGLNPTGVDPIELFVKLVDFHSGRLMNPITSDDSLSSSLDYFIDLIQNDSNQHFVVMKKALLLGIITNKNGMFYIKTEPVGDSEDKLLTYLKENTAMYESYVRKEVALKDNVKPEEASIKVQQIFSKTAPVENKEEKEQEIDKLRREAKDLNIKGYHSLNVTALKDAIDLAKGVTA